MAETFSIGTHVTALWGHRWYAGVVDDILDGGRAYEIAWADEETCNEVPAADVRALAVNEEPRPKKQKVQKPRADTTKKAPRRVAVRRKAARAGRRRVGVGLPRAGPAPAPENSR